MGIQGQGNEGYGKLGELPHNGECRGGRDRFWGQEENRQGRQNKSKKLVVVGIEKKIKGVSRLYAKVIPNASSKELGSFIRLHISPKANITTEQ